MNKNPYEVLGVSPDATDDQIKAAYREMARKYHPDNYVNSPLSDLAEEKMKEVNEAYDAIQKMRVSGGNGGGYGGAHYNQYTGDTSSRASDYNRVRNCINSGNYAEAEAILNAIPASERRAEWSFLMGCVCAQKGWYLDAQRYFESACQQDPSNAEYRNALNSIRGAGQNFGQGYRTNTNAGGCSACDVCSGLLCADCLCECCGGDLIRCC